MDWSSWLSKTNLEPSLIYEYGLTFSTNELEHDDVIYFNHEFLQSLGISIGKHRLEILKLAKHDKRLLFSTQRSLSKILVAIKKTKRCLVDRIRGWIHCEESSQALVVVPRRQTKRRSGNGKWKKAFLKRNKSMVVYDCSFNNNERLLLTNGSPYKLDSFTSPMIYDLEQINWDSMFQDLKPT